MSSREQERKALRLIPCPSPAARSMISCGDVQRRIACCRSERPLQAATQERSSHKSASEGEEGGGRLLTGLTRLQRDQIFFVHHHRKSIVTSRIRYRLGSMNTASFVATDSFGKTQPASLLRPITSLAGATAAPFSSWKMAS